MNEFLTLGLNGYETATAKLGHSRLPNSKHEIKMASGKIAASYYSDEESDFHYEIVNHSKGNYVKRHYSGFLIKSQTLLFESKT